MRHHTVTATFTAPPDEVFAYLAEIEKLPEWATEFAREVKLVEGHYKVVNGSVSSSSSSVLMPTRV